MEDKALIERIAAKQAKLQNAAVELKQHFVGIDGVIDRIVTNIEAWYCMPELCTRPTIVCLWGLTGIGKTDLVRRLVKSLGIIDNFVEIQLTNKGSSTNTYATSLQGLLTSSNIASDESGILLLDEIQRFRSIDEDGNEIHDYYFQDLWMLLSDGSFGSASDNKQRLFEILFEAAYYDDLNKAKQEVGVVDDDEEEDEEDVKNKEVEKRRKFKQTYWSARQLKRQLRLTESIDEIMQWDSKRKLEILAQKMDDKSIYTPEIYSKLLVFISGNLDEAYRMADEAEETDVDADVFHKHSLRINLLSIKSALKNRFKPEQIARFGNAHVIYPALSRASYEEIIERKVLTVLDGIETVSGVRIVPDQSVYEAIYRNGVFPVQGTRPVFSTISTFFESALPSFTLRALQLEQKEIVLKYENKSLTAQIGNEMMSVKNEGDIDKIKSEKRNDNQLRKVAIHEAGHAVAYGVLFGYVPTQVAVNVASEDKNGFIGIHNIDGSRRLLLDEITCLLAGRSAEQIVMGEDFVTSGASGDIEKATVLAGQFIRIYGMAGNLSKITIPAAVGAAFSNLDIKPTNEMIEEILQKQFKAATKLLNERLPLLHELSEHLIQHDKIDPEQFIEMFGRYGIKVEQLDAKETIYPRYADQYRKFWKDKRLVPNWGDE